MSLSTILAQATATPAAQGSGWSSILMMVAIIAIFYLFMIRPQQKKQKELAKWRDALASGDKVVTAGGIHGRIKEVHEGYILLEVADNVRIRVDKSSIYATAAESQQNADTTK